MSTATQLNLEAVNLIKPHSVTATEGARRGTFKISAVFLQPENIDHVKGLFDGMIVLHTEACMFDGSVRYYAVHQEFDPVKANDVTPEYVVMVDRTGDEPRFFYERVTQESMV